MKRVIAQIDSVQQAMYYHRIVGLNVFSLPEKNLEGMCCVDIGAHVGLFSLGAVANTKCKAYAFEPDEANYERICRNVALNGFKEKIIVQKKGVGEKCGTVNFYKDVVPWSSQSNSCHPTGGECVTTDVVCPENVFNLVKEPIFYLKSNCEGGEVWLLKYLAENKPLAVDPEMVSISIHPGLIDEKLHEELVDNIRAVIDMRKGKKTEIRLTKIGMPEAPGPKWVQINTLKETKTP